MKELKKLGVTVFPSTLSLFYRKNKVNYRVVKYQFSRARETPISDVQRFVVDLARRVKLNQNIVYFDETSCNMWMRKRMSWCSRAHPVRMHLNKKRGKGVTVMGAIGHNLSFGVFGLAKTTNQHEVAEFLKRVRNAVTPYPFTNNERIVMVLDNHKSYKTEMVRVLAH